MAFPADPQPLARRLLRAAHNRDGLPEIAVGVTFLVGAALSYAQAVLPPSSIAFKAAAVAPAVLIPALCLGAPSALQSFRRRFLMDRVGYVEPKPIERKHMALGVAFSLLTAAALFGAVTQSEQPDRWVLAGTGLAGGALAALAGRLLRFVIGGLLMAAMGMLLAFSALPLPLGFAILFGSAGLLAVASGGIVLRRFLRQPAESGESQ
jgi:hypothetical protein